MTPAELAQALKEQARQRGFTLAGITSPDSPSHFETYRGWIQARRHGEMGYLGDDRALERRADPRRILPECRSILVVGMPYHPPPASPSNQATPHGRVAAYAMGDDYHLIIPPRLKQLLAFLEEQVGHPIPNRIYTDTGPVLERDLAQRAGLGWIGKNTCLISPKNGSYFLLGEILLGIELPPDRPFTSDHCGTCTRCIEACPTNCILPDRTLDARRCISYLTIENKGDIPEDLRPLMGLWVFGCDVCQQVCPWNQRFGQHRPEPVFEPRAGLPFPSIAADLSLTPQEFNQKFKDSPLKRAKRRGYQRNLAIAAANSEDKSLLPVLETAQAHDEPLVARHAEWASDRLKTPKNSKPDKKRPKGG
ncbi:MAG TPA: tRNA epoxyqueuosine(34) reductase QueG [Anaerolineae bacterium]|jgi:epoxyqueuosine reductase|nr:tRNA epoxyqueuosine(34) reductase QueG [Anaerolineae bacterium]